MEFKPAKCPTCGGSLHVPEDRASVHCMYCGGVVLVREAITAGVAASVPNLLRLATAAAQSKNHQEAYDYFTRALELDSHNSEAWAGKAEAAGRLSSQQSFRLLEMINYFSRSIEVVSDDHKSRAEETAGNTISQITTQYYNRMRSGLSPGFAEGQTWMLYLHGLNDVLSAVAKAHRLTPRSLSLLQTGIYICSDNSGYLPYVNRSTGQVARRPLPPEMATIVAGRRREYTDALQAIAPQVIPISIDNSYQPSFFQQMTAAKWTIVIVVILLFLGLISSVADK